MKSEQEIYKKLTGLEQRYDELGDEQKRTLNNNIGGRIGVLKWVLGDDE